MKFRMPWKKVSLLFLTLPACLTFSAAAADLGGISTNTVPLASNIQAYILAPNDVVQVKVYQEDDLETKMRIARDGTSSFPLIGVVQLGGKTVEQASNLIKQRLGKDFLVNPQITLTVVEYSKRRFTVLGQVQKPGTFEIPNEESVTFLQAIAMAGGYTRLANKGNVTVTRMTGGRKVNFSLDVNEATKALDSKPFEILPEDTITVSERVF
jgi:polysaccharide export outer membrane protein